MRVRLAHVLASTLPLITVACGSRQAAAPHPAQAIRNGAIVVMDQGHAKSVPYAPSGTAFDASLDQPVDTRLSTPGEAVTATLIQPILSLSGETLVPAGTQLHGRIDAI